jgi:hypothetical protein
MSPLREIDLNFNIQIAGVNQNMSNLRPQAPCVNVLFDRLLTHVHIILGSFHPLLNRELSRTMRYISESEEVVSVIYSSPSLCHHLNII